MAMRLAFFTFGHLKAPFGHPDVQGFIDRVPGVYGAADDMGLIDRSRRSLEDYSHSWGKIVTPKCWGEPDLPRTAATLSLWEDIESVAAFAYHGLHGEAMTKRTEWFVHRGLPEQTGWWIEEGDIPDWQTAADRMDHLHDHGSSPHAFNLKKPFDAEGNAYRLDTERIRQKAAVAP